MNKFLAEAAGALNVFVAILRGVDLQSLGASEGAPRRGDQEVGLLMGMLGAAIPVFLVCDGVAGFKAIYFDVRAPHAAPAVPPGRETWASSRAPRRLL